jgi:hypothetical protein
MPGPLQLRMSEWDADSDRLDELSRHLRRELNQVDGAEVASMAGGVAPEGSRALDVVAVGGLVVTLLSSDALRAVVSTVRHWLSRGHDTTSRTVHLEIDGDVLELSDASDADQQRLVDAFVSRHSVRSASP